MEEEITEKDEEKPLTKKEKGKKKLGTKLPSAKLRIGKVPTGKVPTGKLPTGKLPTGKLTELRIDKKYREFRKKKKSDPDDKLKERFWPFGKRQLTPNELIHLMFVLTGFGLVIAMIEVAAQEYEKYQIEDRSKWETTHYVVYATKCLAYISGVAGLIMHPMVFYNQTLLTLMDKLRDEMNNLRGEANKITSQNTELKKSVDTLTIEADRLKALEPGLNDIAEKQGVKSDQLLELIEENKRINKELRQEFNKAALQRIMGTMMDCDINGDFVLEGTEIDRLIIGLQLVEEIELDTEEFRQMIVDAGGSLGVVFDIMKQWFAEEEDVEDMSEEDIEAMFEEDTEAILEEDKNKASCHDESEEKRRLSLV